MLDVRMHKLHDGRDVIESLITGMQRILATESFSVVSFTYSFF